MSNTLKILRLPEVRAASGKSRSAIYAAIKDATWPPQVNIGGKSVGWLEHEVDAVIRARAAGHTDSDVRELIAELIVQRRRLMAAVKLA